MGKRLSKRGDRDLFGRIAAILDRARWRAVRAVNAEVVTAYWLVGREIVGALQGGEARAEYGARVIRDLSQRLTERYGPGFSATNLKYFRLFYQAFRDRLPRIGHPMGDQSALPKKGHPLGDESAARAESASDLACPGFRPTLGWSHYRALMRVEDHGARDFYEAEAAEGGWTRRELERQIASRLHTRLLASRDKKGMLREIRKKAGEAANPVEMLKDPYVLEFLNLPDLPRAHESDLEAAIIDNLQAFLLEMGRGFSFVARQKRLRFDDRDFYVDLVFYNYLLKCFVLIDLKIGELTHQDIGQMDGYVRMFEEHGKPEGDNPTIGLILCSEKNEAIVRYSVLHESRQLFASRYKLYLPSEEELKRELERERRAIEERADSRATARRPARRLIDRGKGPGRGK